MGNQSRGFGLIYSLISLLASIGFFSFAVYVLMYNKVLESLLSFVTGIILLSTSLSIYRDAAKKD